MPELPEVETVRLGLSRVMTGRRITRAVLRRSGLRLPFPEGLGRWLEGRRIQAVERRAKYLLIRFVEADHRLLVHLGMSGRMRVFDPGSNRQPMPHDHVEIALDSGARVVFNDARRFGMMLLVPDEAPDHHPLLAGLGPEPLDDGFTAACLAERLRGRSGPIKAVLLDQRVIAGLGNIYVAEALWRARLSPRRRAESIRGMRAERLWRAIRAVLAEAIAAGGSTLRDHMGPDGTMGYFQHGFAVYGRAGLPCPECRCNPPPGGGVRMIRQGGRASYYCPVLQR